MNKKRVAILISGRGSNMMALVEAAAAPDFPAEIALVLSNRPDAAGLEWAASRGIRTAAIDHKTYGKDREAFERAARGEGNEGIPAWMFMGLTAVAVGGAVALGRRKRRR